MPSILIRAWCHLNARWVPSKRIKGRAAKREEVQIFVKAARETERPFCIPRRLTWNKTAINAGSLDMGETRHGVDGACKALVLGHGGFDSLLAPEMPL